MTRPPFPIPAGELRGRPPAGLRGQRAVRGRGAVPPELRPRSHLQALAAEQLPAPRPRPLPVMLILFCVVLTRV